MPALDLRLRFRAWHGLIALMLLNALARGFAAFVHDDSALYPDEHFYLEMARSIARTGHPLIRGVPAHVPALLAPALDAPFTLLSPPLALLCIRLLGVLLVTLAAIPIYKLALQVGIGGRSALVVVALSLSVPELVWTGNVLTEPLAYLCFCSAAYLSVRALTVPSLRREALALGAFGLCALARSEFWCLPLCYLTAALILRARANRALLKAFARAHAMTLGVFLVALVAALVVEGGPNGLAGMYSARWTAQSFGGLHLLLAAERNLRLFVFSSGAALVPIALLGLWRRLPRRDATAPVGAGQALAAFSVVTGTTLLAVASFWAPHSVETRYLFYLYPLIFIFAVIGFERIHLPRYAAVSTAIWLMLAVAGLLDPLTKLVNPERAGSILVLDASLLGGAATRLPPYVSLVMLATPFLFLIWRRKAALVVPALLVMLSVSVTTLVILSDPNGWSGHGRGWVDARAGKERAQMLMFGRSSHLPVYDLYRWNSSLDRLYVAAGLRGLETVDEVSSLDTTNSGLITTRSDGTLLVAGKVVSGLFVADLTNTRIRFGRPAIVRYGAFLLERGPVKAYEWSSSCPPLRAGDARLTSLALACRTRTLRPWLSH